MKTYFRFALAFLVLLSFAIPAFSAQEVIPYRNHTGYVGNSNHIWQYGYFDKLVGDGTNGTINGFKKVVVAKTASYSVTAADCGKVFSNKGATAQIYFDLPAISTSIAGCEYTFLVSAATSVTVNPNGTDYLKVMTNAAGDGVTNGTAGSCLKLLTDGYNWYPNGTAYGTWSDSN